MVQAGKNNDKAIIIYIKINFLTGLVSEFFLDKNFTSLFSHA